MKALVAFGTKYGSTAKVAAEIAAVLRARGSEVEELDLRKRNKLEIESFDLVVVGSCVINGSWTVEAKKFLEKNGTVISRKAALFACCGDVMLDPARSDEYRRRYLENIATRYGISSPISMALFGGMLDFNRYGFLLKTFLNSSQANLERRGVDLTKAYDFRDWDVIRRWAGSLEV